MTIRQEDCKSRTVGHRNRADSRCYIDLCHINTLDKRSRGDLPNMSEDKEQDRDGGQDARARNAVFAAHRSCMYISILVLE